MTDTAPPIVEDLSDSELTELAQGCREWSCPGHGAYNRERSRRARNASCVQTTGCDGYSHGLACNEAWYSPTPAAAPEPIVECPAGCGRRAPGFLEISKAYRAARDAAIGSVR